MIESITNFFHTIFSDNIILATILISILPIIELKGAIPFALSKTFWGELALSPMQAFGFALLGSSLVVPILALIFKPIYVRLKDKKFFKGLASFFVGGAEKKSADVSAKSKDKSKTVQFVFKILTVVLFVSFPVPLTGVWTGTCLAVLMGLNFWWTCATVILGNVFCGLIVTFICNIFPNATNIILYVFLALLLLFMIIKLILHFIKKNKKTAQAAN